MLREFDANLVETREIALVIVYEYSAYYKFTTTKSESGFTTKYCSFWATTPAGLVCKRDFPFCFIEG